MTIDTTATQSAFVASWHTDFRRERILDALAAFANQRPDLDFANYGDVAMYRSESRSITRDLHDARTLLSAVRWRSSIDADALLAAARNAFSGRLTITEVPSTKLRGDPAALGQDATVRIDYCAGQYYPTEYRRAVCAVLASALWSYTRDLCMPSAIIADGNKTYPHVNGSRNQQSAGDWLRHYFRREFGAHIARRWFD